MIVEETVELLQSEPDNLALHAPVSDLPEPADHPTTISMTSIQDNINVDINSDNDAANQIVVWQSRRCSVIKKGAVYFFFSHLDDKRDKTNDRHAIHVQEEEEKNENDDVNNSKKLWGTLGPHWFMLPLTYALHIAVTAYSWQALRVVASTSQAIPGIILPIVSICLYTCVAWNDPGFLFKTESTRRPGWERYCDVCASFTRQGARHCFYCQVCVEDLDHHCPWVGKCIGKRTVCCFYWWLFFIVVSFGYDILFITLYILPPIQQLK